MRIYIKYMVSLRCKLIVKEILDNLKIDYAIIELGMVECRNKVDADTLAYFDKAIREYGLGVLDDNKAILVDRIKSLIIELVHYTDEMPNVKYSVFISDNLGYNYTYLANLFSEVKVWLKLKN